MKKVVICSGAGLSVASGLPTFRCQGGLWEQFKLEEVCYLPTFLENYIKTNEFYAARRKQLEGVKPNQAHLSLAEAQRVFMGEIEFVHLTTNVDDLLEQAGCENITHLHGNLKELILNWRTDKERIVPAHEANWEDDNLYPVKPNVVFFNENAPAYETAYNTLSSLQEGDCVIVIGSSEEVFNFTYTAKYMCSTPATVFYIGPERPKVCHADRFIYKKAEEIDFVAFFQNLIDNDKYGC